MAANSKSSTVRVAVIQAEPVWFDLDATAEKTCTLIAEAAAGGAVIVTFPECWIPGYPAWIWSARFARKIRYYNADFFLCRARPVDLDMMSEYMKNSLTVDSAQMRKIRECAATNKIIVVLRFSENRHNSLYISQAIIGTDGEILALRRKIKATHMERTIFGDASADCLNSVVDTDIGRVGALSCWEHIQPLLKYYSYSQREQIHVAAWPPLFNHSGDELWSMSRQGKKSISWICLRAWQQSRRLKCISRHPSYR